MLLLFCRREDDIIASCDRITGAKRQPIDVGRVLITRSSNSSSSSSSSNTQLSPAGHTPEEQQQQQEQQQDQTTGATVVKYFINICSCGVAATTPPIVNKLKWLRTLCEQPAYQLAVFSEAAVVGCVAACMSCCSWLGWRGVPASNSCC
jgi:hypothetical protein